MSYIVMFCDLRRSSLVFSYSGLSFLIPESAWKTYGFLLKFHPKGGQNDLTEQVQKGVNE